MEMRLPGRMAYHPVPLWDEAGRWICHDSHGKTGELERFDMAEIRHKEIVVGRFERLDTLDDSVRTVSSSRSIPGRFVPVRRAAHER